MPMPPPIAHVVVLMMENHSFDRILGYLRSLDPAIDGVDPTSPGRNPDWPSGTPVLQAPTTARNVADDPMHDLDNVLRQIDHGRMDGFLTDFGQSYPNAGTAERAEIMAYYARGALPALHFLAESFVACDRWFSSMPGPTWPNRLFAHSGTSLGHVDMPSGVFSPGFHLYDQTTLYDVLNEAGIGWAIYYGDFPQSLVLLHQLDQLDRYFPLPRFSADAAAGRLAPYVFIEPAYFGTEENDQHPPQDVLRGDVLIAQVYNALLADPAEFEKTLLIVVYDEHGGFYDHVPPPATVPPDANTAAFGFDLLGVRVPAVLVSPWLDPGGQHAVLDHTSLLRMAGDLWPSVAPGVAGGKLGRRAAVAHSPLDGLSWRATPRTALPAAPVATGLQAVQVMPTLDGRKQALLDYSQFLESKIQDPATKQALMGRAHEVQQGSLAQAQLATDRLDAFMAERRGIP
jgi:phospholipase C